MTKTTIRYLITDESIWDATDGMQKDRASAVAVAESLLYAEKGDISVVDVKVARVRSTGYTVEFIITASDLGEVYSEPVA